MEVLASPIAAVVHETRAAAIDRLMLEAAKRLRARGVKLGGLVQHNVAKHGTDCAEMLLEDLASGKLVTISLERSRRGSGCRLDAAGLAEAAALGAHAASPRRRPRHHLEIRRPGSRRQGLAGGARASGHARDAAAHFGELAPAFRLRGLRRRELDEAAPRACRHRGLWAALRPVAAPRAHALDASILDLGSLDALMSETDSSSTAS